MATSIYSRETVTDDCEDEETLKGTLVYQSSSSGSVRTFGKTRVNCATIVENDLDSDLDEEEEEEEVVKKTSSTRIKKIDLSPEAQQKRQEVYNKWVQSVISRERERKRLSREKHEADELKALREQENKDKAADKVAEWMRKKQIETEKKMTKLNEMKKKAAAAPPKPKELKKAINFDDWLQKKNEAAVELKKNQEEKEKQQTAKKENRQIHSTASYHDWIHSSASKPKPVPMNKGLESLRGSTTKIYVNPIPWQTLDD